MLCSLYPLAVCHTLWMAHRRTANLGILIKCILGCIPQQRRHYRLHSGKAWRCVSPYDGRYIHTIKVSFSFLFKVHRRPDWSNMVARRLQMSRAHAFRSPSSISMNSMANSASSRSQHRFFSWYHCKLLSMFWISGWPNSDSQQCYPNVLRLLMFTAKITVSIFGPDWSSVALAWTRDVRHSSYLLLASLLSRDYLPLLHIVQNSSRANLK